MTIEAKDVIIKEFEYNKYRSSRSIFRVNCSKGTYIRSLVKDFGEKLNNGAICQSCEEQDW